jgi:hypothetical protein
MKPKNFWIGERRNPQLGTYYVLYGARSIKEAKSHEKTVYGTNIMHKYPTKAAYDHAIAILKDRGERIHT